MAMFIGVISIAIVIWADQMRTHPAIPATPIHNTQSSITIPTARISQAQAIHSSFFVLPESPIGAIAMIGSSFGALSGYMFLRSRKNTPKI